MKRLIICLNLVLTINFFSIYDLPAEEITDKTVLVSVNGENITVGHMIAFQSKLSEQYQSMEDSVLFDGILKQLIQQIILSQKVNRNSSKIRYALENQTWAFLSTEIIGSLSEKEVKESEIESFYKDFSNGIKEKKEYDASHILVETEIEALDILGKLKKGIDFSELAKTHSTGPSGKQGGNLGWFGLGAMVPAFEDAVIDLKVDDYSLPVQTQFGWHIIKLNNMRIIPIPTIDKVREELIAEIKKKHIEIEVVKIIDSAEVVYNEIEIDPQIIREVWLLND